MQRRCNVCGEENGSCNRYLLCDSRIIAICPRCLVFGYDDVSKAARAAHKDGRMISEEDKKGKKK